MRERLGAGEVGLEFGAASVVSALGLWGFSKAACVPITHTQPFTSPYAKALRQRHFVVPGLSCIRSNITPTQLERSIRKSQQGSGTRVWRTRAPVSKARQGQPTSHGCGSGKSSTLLVLSSRVTDVGTCFCFKTALPSRPARPCAPVNSCKHCFCHG